MIDSPSQNAPANILSMLARYAEIKANHVGAPAEKQDELNAEQDTICRSVVEILSDNMDGLESIISALTSVGKVIACTYDHDSETEERVDEPGKYSGADIVKMLSTIELEVEDAMCAAEWLFGVQSTDQTETA